MVTRALSGHSPDLPDMRANGTAKRDRMREFRFIDRRKREYPFPSYMGVWRNGRRAGFRCQ